jgi:hypothetical protein
MLLLVVVVVALLLLLLIWLTPIQLVHCLVLALLVAIWCSYLPWWKLLLLLLQRVYCQAAHGYSLLEHIQQLL